MWRVSLPPQSAGTVCNIGVFNENKSESIQLNAVIFGDVWLCACQSNMGFKIGDVINATDEIEKYSTYTSIRLLTVETVHPTPEHPSNSDDLKPKPWFSYQWQDPSTKEDLELFSAVCFLFARNIYDQLGKLSFLNVSNNIQYTNASK